MANTIRLKRGSGSDPSASDLVVGEVALRTDSGKLFTKKDDNSVAEIGGGSGAIDDGAITNAKVASDAAIAGSKISPVFGGQNITTTAQFQSTGSGSNSGLKIANAHESVKQYFQTNNDNSDFYITYGGTGGAEIQLGYDGKITLSHGSTTRIETTTAGVSISGNLGITGTVDGRDVATDGSKLDGIAAGATNVTNTNQLTNGAGFLTSVGTSNISDNAVTVDKIQDFGQNRIAGRISSGNGSLQGLDASEVRAMLNVADGATNVTNNNQLTNGAGYSTFSGSYNDLSNKPTIPTNNNQLSNGAGYITSANGGNADQVDGLHASSFLRSDTADGAGGDITFSGGAGAVTINSDSDIRFSSGDWTGESCKIQHHSNALYIQGGSNSGANIIFRSNSGTDRWYINTDGDLYPASDNAIEIGTSSNRVQNIYMAGGIFLGGTGSGNYLDDFEEGDWTPSLRGGSNGAGGYSIRDGSYVKIGRLVHVNFGIAITSKGSMSGDLNVGSLPFTVQHIINDTSIEASGICGYWKHVSPNSSHLTIVAEQDSNIFVRHTVGAEDDPDQMQASDIDSDFTIRGSITYYTSQN